MLRGNFLIPDIENYTVMVSECPNKSQEVSFDLLCLRVPPTNQICNQAILRKVNY